MKKLATTTAVTSGSALAALVGLSAWSMTAAVAVTGTDGQASADEPAGAFANCGTARLSGASDFETTRPGFAPHLDVDGDGIACESSGDDEGLTLLEDGTVAPLSALPPFGITGPGTTVFLTCDEARGAGALPLLFLQEGYNPKLDADLSGIACESEADVVPGYYAELEQAGLLPAAPGSVPAPAAPARPVPTEPVVETPGLAAAGPYAGCGVARLDGASDFGADTPGFAPHLDVDGDGIACESSGDDEGYLLLPDGRVVHLSELPGSSIVTGPDSVVYDTCADARAAGALPLLHLEPGYSFALDRNTNGVACEDAADEHPVYVGPGVETPDPVQRPAPEAPQIEEVPVGGADTGAEQSADRTGLLVGGSGLALVGLAGAGLLVRRAGRG